MNVTKKDVMVAFKHDKEDGYKSGMYFFSNDIRRIMAFDSQEELNRQENTFKINNINYYKSIAISDDMCKEFCIKSGNIKVYRHCNNEEINLLCLSPILGYLPAFCETTIIEVVL